MARALFGLLSLCCCLTLSAEMAGRADANANATTAVQPALERFLARPNEPLSQYRAHRSLEGQNARFNKRGTLEAITELSSAGQFTYTIVSEGGSEYVREKVLRPLLETEARAIATGTQTRSAVTADNYEILGGEMAEPGVVKLFAKPRRKDMSLIEGAVFVSSEDGDLLKVEGRMAKSPSFWATRVDVTRWYDRIAGVRVPVRVDSTAHLRFAGESTLSMIYRYEMVNGKPVAQ